MAKKVKVARFSAVGEPSPNSGKYVIFAVTAIVLILVGFAFGKSTTSSSSPSTTAVKETPLGQGLSSYGPKKLEGIVPVGYSHNTKGAVAAATSYIGLVKQLYFANDDAFNTSVVQITTPSFTRDFIEGIAVSRTSAREFYKADPNAYFREFPLGYFVQSEEKDEVTVVVWSGVMLASRPNFDGKTESKIHAIQLVWQDNDWKVQNWVTRDGPTPRWQATEANILPVDDFLRVIEPFTGGYDYVPSF